MEEASTHAHLSVDRGRRQARSVLLAFTLPNASVVGGIAVLAAGATILAVPPIAGDAGGMSRVWVPASGIGSSATAFSRGCAVRGTARRRSGGWSRVGS